MNTRQQRRNEGEADERQEDNANSEERGNLIAALRDQSEALTAVQQTLAQGQATQDRVQATQEKVVEMLAMLLAGQNQRQGRQGDESPPAARVDEGNEVTPAEGAANATEGPETANDASEGRRGQLFTSNFETGTTTGLQQGPQGVLTTVMDITGYQQSIAAIPWLETNATAPEAWNWIERMQTIQLKGGKVRPSERMTTATVELIRGVMGTAQSIFANDSVLFWSLEQVTAALKKRYEIATDHRVYTELGKLTPAEDEGRDATNKVITAVRGIVRLATMDFSKWGHAQNKTAVRLILEKLGPKTRKALGPTGRFAVKSLAELVGKVASLYDTQERVRRSEEECGLTTSPEPTQRQATTTTHSHRHQRIASNALDMSHTEELQGALNAAELDFADTEKTVQVQTQALEFNNGDEEAKLMDRCLNCGTRGHMSRNCLKPKVDNPEMEDVRRLFKEALARGRQKMKP